MQTSYGHLSYCTNIHPGESWQDHFEEIRKSIPVIKKKLSPDMPFGIGLRLSDQASTEISLPENIRAFRHWLKTNDCYVYTMNGFPFGNFHQLPVKENVHQPDWTRQERVSYTIKLFDVLKELIPTGMEGSISTSPLSYRHSIKEEEKSKAIEACTENILKVIFHLQAIYRDTGKILHLNIEPEPDGLLENTFEFIDWYKDHYIPAGMRSDENPLPAEHRQAALQRHLRLCYDICHSALAYENIRDVTSALSRHHISIGKVQISSAINIDLKDHRSEKIRELERFDEAIYLHQVVARDAQNSLHKFRDLPEALVRLKEPTFKDCRVHFHVPVFAEDYDLLSSTQESILQTLSHQGDQHISDHWEVETYTWTILPQKYQLPMNESIARELEWVLDKMNISTSIA